MNSSVIGSADILIGTTLHLLKSGAWTALIMGCHSESQLKPNTSAKLCNDMPFLRSVNSVFAVRTPDLTSNTALRERLFADMLFSQDLGHSFCG
jgi:hypothetical protein